MKKFTILIPHNKPPHLHDLLTQQCKNICSELQKKVDLEIIWVNFSTDETEISKITDPKIINSSKYKNALEILNDVKPDCIMINGSLDFQNVEFTLASKFKKLPLIVLFFRSYLRLDTHSTFETFRSRMRSIKSLFTENTGSSFTLFLKQYFFLFRTLRSTNYNLFSSIKFLLSYTKLGLFSYSPVNRIVSGDANLCTTSNWPKKLISAEFDTSSIFVVGDPYYDTMFLNLDKQKPKNILNNSKIKILFCPSARHEHGLCSKNEEQEMITKTINEILKSDDFEIAIKIHPSSASWNEYENEILTKLSSKIQLYQNEDLAELVNQYDVMLTYGGTGAIHYAAFLKKPIVSLDFNNHATGTNIFIHKEIVTSCYKLESLRSDIQTAKKNTILQKDCDEYIEKYIGQFDGKNSERTALQILKTIKKHHYKKKIFYIDRFTNWTAQIFEGLQEIIQNEDDYDIFFIGPHKKNLRTWLSDQNVKDSKRIWHYGHFVRSLLSFIKKEKPNIVHFSFEWRMFGPLSAALKLPLMLFLLKTQTKSKIIVDLRAPLISKQSGKWEIMADIMPTKIPKFILEFFMKIFIKTICRLSHKIIVDATANKEGLIDFYGIDVKKIEINTLILPPQKIPTHSLEETKIRKQFSNKKIILCFGVISPRKSYDTIVKSFSEICHKIPDHVLIIAGLADDDGKSHEKMLRNLVKQLDLQSRVFFVGYVDDEEAEDLFDMAEIALYIYRPYPDSSGALFYAIYHSTPCIVSNSETFTEILDIDDAIFVNYDDENQLSNSLLELSTNSDLRNNFKQKMKNVSKRTSKLTTSNKYLEIYKDIIEN